MPLKILVVDDSATDRQVLQHVLSDYEVLTATDGLDATLQLERHTDIDLIILDLNMPGMNGFQFLEFLGENHLFERLRTIILTNYDEPDNEVRGLQLGAVDFVRKPVDAEVLKARVMVHGFHIQKQRELAWSLYKKEITYGQIFNQVPVGIAISFNHDALAQNDNPYFLINPTLENMLGRSRNELMHLGWAAITHPDDVEENLRLYHRLQRREINHYEMDKRYVRPDGSIVWVHILVSSLVLPEESQLNHISLVVDITDRKEMEHALQESERSKSVLLSHLPGMAYRCLFDRDWTMQFVSDGCLNLTGYPPECIINNRDLSFNDIIAPEYREELWREWEYDLLKQLPFRREYEIITSDGTRKWVLELGQGIFTGQGGVEALEGIIFDISGRKATEQELKHTSEHDRLTGLYNNDYLIKLLDQDMAAEPSAARAVVSVNLTSIHSLTALYGLRYSLDLIKRIAEALEVLCTEDRMLFSTYVNSFIFYVKSYETANAFEGFCRDIANKLKEVLAAEGIAYGIGAYVIDNAKRLDAEQILKNLMMISEVAINNQDRGIQTHYFDASIEQQILRDLQLRSELDKVCAEDHDGGLFLQFQPIFSLKTNRICGFEALARLRSDTLGLVSPLEFIPIAEKTKLIIPIGNKVILQALRFLKTLESHGFPDLYMSINVSVLQLLQGGFCRTLFETLHRLDISPNQIGLELTESIFASDHLEINRTLAVLKQAGMHIAIDDFGTGYSSLAREWELNVDCLKIDKSFVQNLMDFPPEKSIISDIISMAHRFDHDVVAEGIEYESQRNLLAQWGCDKIQGYLISRPLDPQAVITLLKEQA